MFWEEWHSCDLGANPWTNFLLFICLILRTFCKLTIKLQWGYKIKHIQVQLYIQDNNEVDMANNNIISFNNIKKFLAEREQKIENERKYFLKLDEESKETIIQER